MVSENRQIKNIWMLSREYGHLAGAGGVKDVTSQLAEALARWTGRVIHVVLPMYGFMNAEESGFQPVFDPLCRDQVLRLPIDMHQPVDGVTEEVCYFHKTISRVNIYLVDAERYREKTDVYSYTEVDESQVDWQKKSMGHHDYFAMNLLLQKAAIELMITLGEKPDAIHCHDGHTAILPALIRETPGYRSYFRGTGCLVTIHNAGAGYHQEVADIPYAHSITSLPSHVINASLLGGKFDPFLVAGQYAILNTVSENYARELQEDIESDRLTGGLGHELKRRNIVLEGVTNGIEPDFFSSSSIAGDNPEMLFYPGQIEDTLAGKLRCKATLLEQVAERREFLGVERFGVLDNNIEKPLFTFIGRLSEQKGIDILLEALDVLMEKDSQVQMLVLGSGGIDIESKLINLTDSTRMFGRLAFVNGYSPELANRIFAAGDFFIVPSRYEPCGLTDFIAQLFGNIPVVRHVGGLVKVIDNVTGIAYRGDSPGNLLEALERALVLYGDKPLMRSMQIQAVKEIEEHYTWTKVMRKYVELYETAWKTQVCK
jgi:starch synthase